MLISSAMNWLTLLLSFVGLLTITLVIWLAFRLYFSRNARYKRRLKRRNDLQWAKDKARQRRMLEARMKEVHEEGLRWKEAPVLDETADRSWSRAREERIFDQDEA